MGLSVGHPTSLEELYRQMSSSPAFARMMQTQDQRDGGSSDPRSWLQARMRTHGLNIPPMPQMAAPPQQMPSQAFSALGAPQGQAPQMAAQAQPMPQLPPMPQASNRQSGGLLSGLIPEGGEFKERLGDMLMGFGGGSNINESLAMGGRAMMEGRRARAPLRAQAAELNRTRQYAIQQGMPPEVAMTLDGPSIMKWVLDRNQPADPMDALKLKREQLEIGNLENPKPEKPDIETLISPDGKQKRSFNLTDPQSVKMMQHYFEELGWTEAPITASSTTINNNMGGKFDESLGKGVAEVYTKQMEQGQLATATKAAAQQLRVLMKGKGGALDGFAATAAPYLPEGLLPEGANDVVAAQAIVSSLIPKQRVPGSGTTSDFDARKYMESLPSIWNKPGANEIILDTVEAYADYQIAISNIIAEAASNPGVTNKAQAIREGISRLPDPFVEWKKYMEQSGTVDPQGHSEEWGLDENGNPVRVK